MIIVKYGADAYQVLYCAIERAAPDGFFYDWKNGIFSAEPAVQLQNFTLDPNVLGRYSIVNEVNVPGQFPIGTELIFWILYGTGQISPNKQVLQSFASSTVGIPWALHLYQLYVFIDDASPTSTKGP